MVKDAESECLHQCQLSEDGLRLELETALMVLEHNHQARCL